MNINDICTLWTTTLIWCKVWYYTTPYFLFPISSTQQIFIRLLSIETTIRGKMIGLSRKMKHLIDTAFFYLFWVETGRVGRHNIFTASTKFMAHNTNAPHIAEEKDSQTKISAFTHFQVRWKMHITDRNQLLKVHFKLFVNLRSSCSIENLPDQGIWQISTLNLLVIGFQRIHKN